MNLAYGCKPPAAGGSGATMENLEKQLICPVCLEMFSKPVVILPCQHNLCRKCAGDVFQSANPFWSRLESRSSTSGSRFRCPSCRHEVVLDRHGVYGLQRNLLVENIIDIYKRQVSSRSDDTKQDRQQQQVTCDLHEDEKINIYCLSCQTPTCSMCKVFGEHKDCEVAPLSSVYVRHKTELSDSIAILVASNDHIQAAITRMEEMCSSIEEAGRRQKEQLSLQLDALLSVLEDRKQELLSLISREQDHKLRHIRALVRCHGDQLEAAVVLVESAIHSMEDRHMPDFIQNATAILEKMAVAARAFNTERPEMGYEDMSHFVVETDDIADVLRNIDFCSGADEKGEGESEEEPEPEYRY